MNDNNRDKYDNNKMDENQLQFIKNKLESCILIGNPGCGKTTTIIEYCIHKYVNNLIKSFLNFYIISFSKDASIDFILRGQKSKYPSLFNNNNIKTIHSLSYKILNYFNNIQLSTSINILILSAYKLIENKTSDELSKVKFLANIKFIIIDEAQDINENQYKLACLLSKKLNIPLILVGDPNQNIYQFQGGSDEYLLNHSNKIFTLNYNYRSSVQLVNFLNYIRPHKSFPEMKTPKKENEKKPFLYVNDINNILQHIKKQLLVSKYNLEDIAIIGPVKLSKEEIKNNDISDYKSVGLQLICNFLHENNIKFIKHFNDINDNNLKGLNETKKIKDHVNILTSHSSKGLEFKKVLVVNYQLKTFSTTISNYDYEKFKYLWYVTLSRAIHKLIIYIRTDHDIFYNIFDVPNNLYLTNNINKLKNKYNLENKLKITDISQYYEITKIINDLSYLTEERMYNFLQDFKYTITKKEIYNDSIDSDNINIYEHNKYSALYGLFIEMLFKAYYYKNNNKLNEFIELQLNKHENIYLIDKNDTLNCNIYKSLIRKGIICNKILYILDDNVNDNNLTINERTFINYYKKHVINNQNIEIHIENILFKHDFNYFKELCNLLLLKKDFELNVFNIALYFYQLNNECKYLLNYNFKKHIESLKIYFDNINEYSKKFDHELVFDLNCNFLNLNIIGSIDFINKKGVINEIKFTKSFDEKYILQTVLYYNCLYNEWDKKRKVVIINLFQGYKYTINFNHSNNTNWWFNCFISEMLNYKIEKCVFIISNKNIIEYNSKHLFINHDIIKILNVCNLPLFIAYNGDLNEFKHLHDIYNKNNEFHDNKKDKIIKVLNLKNFNYNNNKINKSSSITEIINILKDKNIGINDLFKNSFCYDLNLNKPYLS